VDARGSDRKRSDHALGIFKEIYAHEAVTRKKDMDAEGRYRYRKEHIAPLLKELHAWAVLQAPTAIPKSPMGKAIEYLLNQWPTLIRYTWDGRFPMENNAAERAIRPVVIGRKNWLFIGSEDAGSSAATNYTILESCRMNRMDPRAYLDHVTQAIHAGAHDFHALTPAALAQRFPRRKRRS